MQGLFTQLYSSINRLFTQQDILFLKIPLILEKILFMTHDITINNDYLMMTFMIKDIKIICIKSPNYEIIHDIVLFGDELVILIVVPNKIMFDDFDPDKRMRIVYGIYEYICKYLINMFGIRGYIYASLRGIFNVAPNVLTLKTLDAIGYLYNISNKVFECLDIKGVNTNEILSHSIEDLLDYGGILGMEKDEK